MKKTSSDQADRGSSSQMISKPVDQQEPSTDYFNAVLNVFGFGSNQNKKEVDPPSSKRKSSVEPQIRNQDDELHQTRQSLASLKMGKAASYQQNTIN